MLGNLLKSAAVCATLGLATVGGLTFVPDETWDSFPATLSPVRSKLANLGIAPIKYRTESSPVVDSTVEALGENALGNSYELERFSSSRAVVTQVRIGRSLVESDYVGRSSSASDSGSLDVDSLSPMARRAPRDRADRLASARQNADTPLFSGVSTDPRKIESENVKDDGSSLVMEPQNDPLQDEAFFADEPRDGVSDDPLVDFPPDRNALDASGDPAFNDDAYVSDSPYVAEPLSSAQTASYSDEIEPLATTASSLDAPLEDSEVRMNAQSADLARNDAPQGYLPPNAAISAPSSDPEIVEVPIVQPVQSFDDYINSQSTLPSQNQSYVHQASVEQPAGRSTDYITNTSATMNAPSSGTSTLSLDALVQAASQPRSDEQTRSIFASLNQIRVERANAMTPDELSKLNSALDRLAYEVFYDPKKAILEAPRQTVQGETLATIAHQYDVTPELLAAINNIQTPSDAPLTPGMTLKVVRGPVSAEVSASKKELLLSFNQMYAGRFKFGVPQSSLTLRGDYLVDNKIEKPSCDAVDLNGAKRTIPGGDASNPLGAYWIGLKNGPGLQGTNRPELIGTVVAENGGYVFSNQEISQLNVLLPIGAKVSFVD